MKNIHVLQTDKPSRLYTVNYIDKLDWSKDYLHQVAGATNQNIYITNDEEIKEGDWYLTKDEKLIKEIFSIGRKGKIILTTDQDLIKDGVQAIDDEFLEWFVKNKSCEVVETKVEFLQTPDNLKDGFYYKIIIPKQETLEEVAREYLFEVYQKQFIVKTNDIQHGVLKGFIEGAKWQQQQNKNLYSEQNVTEYAYYFESCYAQRPMQTPLKPSEWFEQFKKKII